MANVKASDLLAQNVPGGPYGTATVLTRKVTQPASGGVAQNDKFYLCILPAGTTVHAFERFNEAGGAGVTASFGFEPVNATLGPAANATYWFSALDVAAAGRSASASHPIKFDYPVFITVLNASAAAFATTKYVGAVLTTTIEGAGV